MACYFRNVHNLRRLFMKYVVEIVFNVSNIVIFHGKFSKQTYLDF
jgi:hypothetical protein